MSGLPACYCQNSREVKEERKKALIMTVATSQSYKISNLMEIERFSTAKRLLRVTSWVFRFVFNLKQKVGRREMKSGHLDTEEIWTQKTFGHRSSRIPLDKRRPRIIEKECRL